MTERQVDPIPLPFPLPPRFAEQLGYRHDRRFVAAYWDAGDEVTVRDDSHLASGLGDWFPWTQYCHRPELRLWRATHNINFGNSHEPATHWLIIDRITNHGFVTTAKDAYKRVQQQRMENIE